MQSVTSVHTNWTGAHLEDLDTPVPVIDLAVMDANIARQQAACNAHGLRLRPHIKTHKVPAIAALQRVAGAVGITAQKTTEAAVFVDVGFDDVIVAVPPVGAHKIARLLDLARRATVRAVVDSATAAQGIAAAAATNGQTVGLLIEVDSGFGRAGLQTVDEVLTLAAAITDLRGVSFDGILLYPSRPFAVEQIARVREEFDRAGLPMGLLSGGGSGMEEYSAQMGADEHRAGTYVFNDASYVLKRQIATLEQCALSVLVTVVSTALPGIVTVDGGTKTFTNDYPPEQGEGIGIVLDWPGLRLMRMSEEHGVIEVAQGTPRPSVGDRLRIVPNHACGCVNMHPALYGMRNGAVEVVWPVAARGSLH